MKTPHIITCSLFIGLTACAAPEPVPPPPASGGPLPVLAAPEHPEIVATPTVSLRLAQAPGPGAPHPPKADIFYSRSKGSRTLIIQSSDPDAKTYANLEEDLSVMYRILSKARTRDEASAFHTRLEDITWAASGGSSVKSMYIEGYGAVFMLGVRFPLVAPQPSDEEPKPKDTPSEEWERAKKEVYSRSGTFELNVDHIWKTALGPQTEEYDAQKVEDLTAGILEGLKNATHIRNLKSDEFVTVAVLGAEAGQVRAVVEKEEREEDGKGKRKTRIENVSGSRGESTMTIRAKKSDIDDFAKGKLNADAFRKKAKILVYLRPLDPSGNPSVNLFNPVRK